MSQKPERWELYICGECGDYGWMFQCWEGCDISSGRHYGEHGGPVEVIPASCLQTFREGLAQKLEARAWRADHGNPKRPTRFAARGKAFREAAQLVRDYSPDELTEGETDRG